MQSQIACSLLALLLQLLAVFTPCLLASVRYLVITPPVFLPCLLASVPPPRPGSNPDPNPNPGPHPNLSHNP